MNNLAAVKDFVPTKYFVNKIIKHRSTILIFDKT